MKINNKAISNGLLGLIGVQFICAGVALSDHYLFSHGNGKQAIIGPGPIEYCREDIPYGAITNAPNQYPIGPIQGDAREFKIYMIGTTTGSSGDCVVMELPA